MRWVAPGLRVLVIGLLGAAPLSVRAADPVCTPAAGQVCVAAEIRDFTTMQPTTGDELLAAIVDPYARAINPDSPVLGSAAVVSPGFVLDPIRLLPGTQALSIVLMHRPGTPPPARWTPASTGVAGFVPGGRTVFQTAAFLLPADRLPRWNQDLWQQLVASRPAGIRPEQILVDLLSLGLLIGRVFGLDGQPAAGRTVIAINAYDGTVIPLNPHCQVTAEAKLQAGPCIYYFEDFPLTTFQPLGTNQTSASGAYLIARAPLALYSLAAQLPAEGPAPENPADLLYLVPGGAGAGSVAFTVLVPVARE